MIQVNDIWFVDVQLLTNPIRVFFICIIHVNYVELPVFLCVAPSTPGIFTRVMGLHGVKLRIKTNPGEDNFDSAMVGMSRSVYTRNS